ncbi:M56 family metallopeptidase [Clostridioides difficile]
MIENIFLTVLKMSITSSYIILFILVIRLLLKKSPKIFSYMLWAVVFFRLISPITIESKLSLIPNNSLIQIDSTSSNSLINYSDYNSQYKSSNNIIKSNTITEVKDSNINNKLNITNILAILWISIVTVMIFYSIFFINKVK